MKPFLSQEGADQDASGLVAERRHLEVEVARLKEKGVDGGDVDDDLVAQTQRPALAQEQNIRVLSLKEDKKEILLVGVN